MHSFSVECATDSDSGLWDEYVRTRPEASAYHLFGWRNVIQAAYGHRTYYLILKRQVATTEIRQHHGSTEEARIRVCGVLPLVHMKSALFGNCLVSLPFFDSGGILASDEGAERTLISECVRLGNELGVTRIELRQEGYLASCNEESARWPLGSGERVEVGMASHKVRMILTLPETSESLMPSFKSKLRSQISRPVKEGMTSRVGGSELIDEFYGVFSENMRHLGSPVHSIALMQNVLDTFSEQSRIFVVYRSREPVAASLVIGFGRVLGNPWASSLRKYSSLSPNMLLYLRMLEYACDHGYRFFDFGRSTPGEGTFNFKKQWGAEPAPLNWYYLNLDGKRRPQARPEVERFGVVRQCWSRLPLIVTKVLGPHIRKNIGL